MKLQNELQETISRMEKIKERIIPYAKELKERGEYKNFDIRLVNDIKYAIYNISTICGWYDKYNCNDDHITTLMKTAFLKTFNVKKVEDILNM